MPGALLLEEPKKKLTRLSIREAVFCRHYIDLGGNGTRAYMKAFKVANIGTAATEAWRLLKKPEIQERLQYAKQAIAEKAGATFGALVEKGVEHLNAQKVISAMVIVAPNKKGSPDPKVKELRADSKSTDFIEVPDPDAQLKAADYLAKLCDYYPKKEASLKLDFELNVAQIYLPKREDKHDGAMEVETSA